MSSTHAASNAPPFELGGRLTGDLGSLDDFARELGGPFEAGQPVTNAGHFRPRRVNADPASADKDLAKLVLALVDLVRRLLERQAGRRVNAGSLTEDQVERMGETFLKLDRKMAELKTEFGLEDEDLDVSLGVIRDLL